MKTEIEVKFINIDIEAMRKKLKEVGAHLEQPMRLMKRVNIEQPEHTAERSFLRVRDEGDKTTLTFKRRDALSAESIDNVKEIEVVVSDFDTTVELFREAGWPPRTLQESRRETWKLNGAEVVIDEWPWIEPYIEIEADDEVTVRSASELLGLTWEEAVFGHIDVIYEMKYEFLDGVRGVIDLAEVLFDAPVSTKFRLREESDGS